MVLQEQQVQQVQQELKVEVVQVKDQVQVDLQEQQVQMVQQE